LEFIVGFQGVCLAIIAAYILALRYPGLKLIIWIALIIRLFAALFNEFILKLPDATTDAIKFENKTWFYAQMPVFEFISSFNSDSKAYTFTWFLSVFYRILGRSPLLLESINIVTSLFCIILVYKISILISDNINKSLQSALLFAIFPSIILYNVVILREVYIVFFLLNGSYFILKWINSKHLKFAIYALLNFIPLYFLHGGLMVGVLVFLTLLLLKSLKDTINCFMNDRILIPQVVLISSFFFGLFFFFGNLSNLHLPYLGNITNIFTLSRIVFQAEVTNIGGSVYPVWLIPNSISSFFLLIFPRLIYFLFSPFIWDIKAINHLLGLVDGIMILFLFYFIIKGLLLKKLNNFASILLIILIPLLITYSWGVGNFGTALRHRVKFIPVFIAISTIYVPKITLTKKSEVPKPNE
jgi:hypothetical protein